MPHWTLWLLAPENERKTSCTLPHRESQSICALHAHVLVLLTAGTIFSGMILLAGRINIYQQNKISQQGIMLICKKPCLTSCWFARLQNSKPKPETRDWPKQHPFFLAISQQSHNANMIRQLQEREESLHTLLTVRLGKAWGWGEVGCAVKPANCTSAGLYRWSSGPGELAVWNARWLAAAAAIVPCV